MRYIILHFLKIINNKSKNPFYHYFITVFCILIIIFSLKINYINKQNHNNISYTQIKTITTNLNNHDKINNKSLDALSNITTDNVISSKKGRVYYYITCIPKTLKKENIQIYNNENEAKKVGKTLSKSCKK